MQAESSFAINHHGIPNEFPERVLRESESLKHFAREGRTDLRDLPLLTIDPRDARDGVSVADLRTQFAHNIRVRDLVSDANRTAARVRAAQQRLRGATGAAADTLAQINALASKLITPPVRYSKPELLTHITYLYSMTTQADQRVPKDAVDRFATLKKELAEIQAALTKLLGPAM